MIIDARENRTNVICLDCETTGLNTKGNEILSLSIVDKEGNVLFDELFKPKKESWEEAESVNHISKEMVEDKKPFKDYVEQIQNIVDSAELVIGFNLKFDMKFLKKQGIKFNEYKTRDVMEMFCDCYMFGKKRVSLLYATRHYNYHWTSKAHGSLADAKATMFVYNQMTK